MKKKLLIAAMAICLLLGTLCFAACDLTPDPTETGTAETSGNDSTRDESTGGEEPTAATEPIETAESTDSPETLPVTEPVTTEEMTAEPETACVHAYGEWTVTVEPTCTVEGERVRICASCGVEERDVLPAAGHTLEVIPGVEPTCVSIGMSEGTRCSVCHVTVDAPVAIPAKGHTLETVSGYAPTCTNYGLSDGRVCSVCEQTVTVQTILPPTGHTEVTDAGKAATCTESGLTEGKHCSTCSAVLVKQEIIPATGHTEVTVSRVEPTCTEAGWTDGTVCSVCQAVLSAQQKLPALGHTAVIQVGIEPTCTEDGLTDGKYCSDCGAILVAQTVISATGHTAVTDAGKASTCTESGLSAGSHCGVCGLVLVEQRVTEALGHQYNDEGVCTRCDASQASKGLAFRSNGDGTCQLIGIGTCTDTDVIIPRVSPDGDTVVSILSYAFEDCRNLTSITIPNTVTDIGIFCYYKRASTELFFTGTCAEWHAVQMSGEYMTDPHMYDVHCSDGKVVMCGASRESLDLVFTSNGDGTCYVSGVGTASDGVIPRYSPDGDLVVSIGDKAFANSTFMIVAIPDSVTHIGERAFEGAYFDAIVIADSVTYIADYAFYRLSATFVTDFVCDAISQLTNLTYLGKYALAGTGEGSPSVVLPDGLTSIEDGLLSGYMYTAITVTVPKSVTYIGKGIFSGWRTTATIEYKGTMAEWRAIEKDANWNSEMYPITVTCTDGEIVTEDRHTSLE